MFIKQIIIQGFKSYKEQTALEPFSPKLNVIVGRNGSGKSNFFAAIRFVLSDAYSNMTREERQALLHEGIGPATLSAYVEVIFDNSDQRFPTGKDELVLRRTIGAKKDEYQLDRKSSTKAEVMSLFDTAGFSRSNPYYVVPQGRITALTNAKDAERLQILKEVAGTRVYEQRRAESLKIMEDTEFKRSKIDELLDYIEERLSELEEEKEELKQFQQMDNDRKTLEYNVYAREQREVDENLRELEDARQNEIGESHERQEHFLNLERTIANIERTIRDTKKKLDVFDIERSQLENDREENIKAQAHLQLMVRDLEETVTSSSEAQTRLRTQLAKLDSKIEEKEAELAEVRPLFDAAVAHETSVKEQVDAAEIERNTLYAKQGRNTQFRTKAERDVFLRKEINDLQSTMAAQTDQISQIDQDVAQTKQRLVKIEKDIKRAQSGVEETKQARAEMDQQEQDLRKQRNELDERRKEIWRDESKHSTAAQSAREDLERAERKLYSTMDRVTGQALRALKRIIEQHNLRGVYGPLYELFEVDDAYKTAVEVVAGGSLFHVVVDNEETATRIVEHLNRERCGRLTLMPLNRLKPHIPEYPTDTRAATVMVQKLQFDPKYKPAFDQVFGKAIICPSLKVASEFARSHGLNAVTLDGDRADRKGALTGGYLDSRRARLETIKNLKHLREQYAVEEEAANTLRQTLQRVEQDITRTRDQISQLNARRKQMLDNREVASGDIQSLMREKNAMEYAIARKEASLQSLQASLRNMATQLQALETELSSPFAKTLSRDEQQRLDTLNEEATQLQRQMQDASRERARLESRKMIIEIELTTNLRRKRDDLAAQLETAISENLGGQQVQNRRSELENVERAIENSTARMQEIEEEVAELTRTMQAQTNELENARSVQMEDHKKLERQRLVAEKYLSKRSALIKRKEECDKNIREVGALPEGPDEALEAYEGVPTDRLLKKLRKVNEGLKKFSHVNKKAFEQYGNFTKQRDTLEKRKEELDTSASSIADLIKNLDQRKDEAIEGTFNQVKENFGRVWQKLVPNGRGELVILRRADGSSLTQDEPVDPDNSSQDPSAEQDPSSSSAAIPHSSIDQYTGIAISVSFNSQHDEGLRMSQLSGGQKSLVALTLIFAIQQCDPAPFYLFDEIDAALDAQYRTAVASMIQELASTAQFIVTTFRPELIGFGDRFYGVTFVGKVSGVQTIRQADALKFVEETAGGAQ
ncbi:putative chromosome segregation protein SudA [Phlyctochytrium arcticum]|nr:putative chromosome segregation protein SudA [Phlyctochytrium arcticum]